MEPVYCSYSVLPSNEKRKSSRKSCKKTNKKSKNSSRCELICNRCGLKQNREQRLTRRKSLRDNQQNQNPFSESYSAPLQKKSKTNLGKKIIVSSEKPVASVITNDSSSKLTVSEKSQLNEKGIKNSVIDIYPVEYWRDFLRPKSVEELKKRERKRKEKKIKTVSYVDSATPLLSDVPNYTEPTAVKTESFLPNTHYESDISARVASWGNFNPNSPPCLGPDGNVCMKSGGSKKISELEVGDEIKTLNGFNKIAKVIKTETLPQEVCRVNNVLLTNRHPIQLNGKWCYPEDVAEKSILETEVYNFELERLESFNEGDHTIIVDDLVCATLGCGPKIEHAKLDADLKWGSGYWNKSIPSQTKPALLPECKFTINHRAICVAE
jgi:hypothetical protein